MANCEKFDSVHYHRIRASDLSLLSNYLSEIFGVDSCEKVLYL
jgi:hypothetical protein